jgi:Tfp pilus assembly protein PilX
MRRFATLLSPRANRRGAALIIALALTLCLTMLIVATQLQITTQLKATKGQRDYDRALELAEAGANAYLNYISYGNSGNYTPWGVADAPIVVSVPSTAEVRTAILASSNGVVRGAGANSITISGTLYSLKTSAGGTTTMGFVPYPATSNITSGTPTPTKPATNQQTGYFVVLTSINNVFVNLVSFGYSNGVVRRVQVSGGSSDIFDWAAVYGLDPNWTSGNTDAAWNFSGSANVVGASGAEGKIIGNNNVTWYDGPVILAANGNTLNSDPSSSQIKQSGPFGAGGAQIPNGHTGTGTMASPFVRRLGRSLNIETADVAAQRWALTAFNDSSATGVNYFRTHNNDSTGIRVLAKVTKTGAAHFGLVRELPTPYTVSTTNQGNAKAYQIGSWANMKLSDYGGDDTNESFYGLRFYPGNYFFEAISQSNSDIMYLRSFADASYPTTDSGGNPASYDSDGTTKLTVWNSTWTSANLTNPNSGMSTEKNIRFWLGPFSGNGASPNTGFSFPSYMEDPSFASRFRIYCGLPRTSTVTVSGTNTNPPPKFRVNLLVYNADGSGSYGNVSIASNVYLYGSLIGWQVGVGGGATIQKQAAEGQSTGGSTNGTTTDRIAYSATAWKELP